MDHASAALCNCYPTACATVAVMLTVTQLPGFVEALIVADAVSITRLVNKIVIYLPYYVKLFCGGQVRSGARGNGQG